MIFSFKCSHQTFQLFNHQSFHHASIKRRQSQCNIVATRTTYPPYRRVWVPLTLHTGGYGYHLPSIQAGMGTTYPPYRRVWVQLTLHTGGYGYHLPSIQAGMRTNLPSIQAGMRTTYPPYRRGWVPLTLHTGGYGYHLPSIQAGMRTNLPSIQAGMRTTYPPYRRGCVPLTLHTGGVESVTAVTELDHISHRVPHTDVILGAEILQTLPTHSGRRSVSVRKVVGDLNSQNKCSRQRQNKIFNVRTKYFLFGNDGRNHVMPVNF